MLGWFKKKFGKKEDPSTPGTTDEVVEKKSLSEDNNTTFEKKEPLQPEPVLSIATPIKTDKVVAEVTTQQEDVTQAIDTVRDTLFARKTPVKPAVPSEAITTSAIDHTPEIANPLPQKPPIAHQPPRAIQPADAAQAEKTDDDPEKKDSLFSRLTNRLEKTRESFTYQMDALFLGKKEIDTNLLDSLEELLITADLGVGLSEELIDYARKKVKRKELSDPNGLKDILKKQIKKYILANEADAALVMPKSGPFVIMVIGVNGVGKTTTIGKITHKFKQAGKSVMLVAADTFRAGAVSQLKIWGERNDVPVISQADGADPSAVVFDALSSAVASNVDVVIVDTAGRMHTKDNLMEELKKIKRVIGKKMRGAPHEILLILDATTGQNAISQAQLFDAAVDITGLALTKLDGTSKGGIVANICRNMNVPIRFIGIGEQLEDLRDFNANDFVDALFQSDK
ncbi:MAG: signal recognition particle-docking protein FtsY [Desulfotalea sp.]|nr:MAG: signal recognition particle-docking protein FtsY [Desulfotalea sp.]